MRHYAAFGARRIGSAADPDTSEWLAQALAAAGVAVERHRFGVTTFEPVAAVLATGEGGIHGFPAWFPRPTPTAGVRAVLREMRTDGALDADRGWCWGWRGTTTGRTISSSLPAATNSTTSVPAACWPNLQKEDERMSMLKRGMLGIAVVFLIGATAGFALLRDRPAEPATGERVLIRGPAGDLVYHRHGAGEAVVLLPSFARSASDFNALVTTLARAGYRTLSLQPRGVEGSALGGWGVSLYDYAADVAAVLDAEGVARARAVVGHAYGNRIARVFAVDFPERVDRLVLLAAGGGKPPAPEVSAAIRRAVFGFDEAARVDAIGFAFFADGKVPPAWVRGWYPLAALQQTQATTAQDYSSWRDGGRAPMLVLQPEDDRPAPAGDSEAFAKRLGERVTRQLIARAGHALLPEQGAEVATRILDYLRARDASDG